MKEGFFEVFFVLILFVIMFFNGTEVGENRSKAKYVTEFHQAGVDVSVCGWKWDERKQEFWRKESTCSQK